MYQLHHYYVYNNSHPCLDPSNNHVWIQIAWHSPNYYFVVASLSMEAFIGPM